MSVPIAAATQGLAARPLQQKSITIVAKEGVLSTRLSLVMAAYIDA